MRLRTCRAASMRGFLGALYYEPDHGPAYGLTGSSFPSDDPWSAHGGCHQLSVNGKQSKITDDDLFAVADRFAIGTAVRVLDEVKSALA